MVPVYHTETKMVLVETEQKEKSMLRIAVASAILDLHYSYPEPGMLLLHISPTSLYTAFVQYYFVEMKTAPVQLRVRNTKKDAGTRIVLLIQVAARSSAHTHRFDNVFLVRKVVNHTVDREIQTGQVKTVKPCEPPSKYIHA